MVRKPDEGEDRKSDVQNLEDFVESMAKGAPSLDTDGDERDCCLSWKSWLAQ